MRLPQKIDHQLKDTIVSIQFTPSVPSETVVGYVHHLLKDQFESVPTERSSWLHIEPVNLTLESRPSVYFQTLDKQFRIDVDGSSITFNSEGVYPGWADFYTIFQQCMKPLFDHAVIGTIERFGIRYINRFDQVYIFDHIDMAVQVGASIPAGYRQQIRTEFDRNGFHSVLTLVNGYPTDPSSFSSKATNSDNQPESIFSLIDVDVIRFFDKKQPTSYENLLVSLEEAHTEEKTIFFSLLKADFLASLNPIY